MSCSVVPNIVRKNLNKADHISAPLHSMTMSQYLTGVSIFTLLLSGMEDQKVFTSEVIQHCKCVGRDDLKVVSRLMKSLRSINLAHGTFCLVTPSCPGSLTMKPDTWIPKVLWKMPHAVREDYECNTGLRHWQPSALLGCPLWAHWIQQYVFLSGAAWTNCKMFPVPNKHSLAVWVRGQDVRNRNAYSGFSHIWEEEGGGIHK